MNYLRLTAFLFFLAPILYGQDTPSLGDIARRARAERANASTPSPSADSNTSADNKVDKPAEADAQAMARLKAERDQANLNEVNLYSGQIRALFNTEKFAEIDEIADRTRAAKARMAGGFWTIHVLYDALMSPAAGLYDSTESAWGIQLKRLQSWVAQRPQSITARVALAGAYLGYAWKARGGGYANQVTDEGWQVFEQRAQQAEKVLNDAFALPAKCPEWYLTMQLVMRAQGMSKQAQTAMFEKAIAFEPDYYYYYRTQAETLLPKWEGEEGEMALFADKVADTVGGKKGDMIYYYIAVGVNCSCDATNQPQGMSWTRIKRGFAAAQEQYGTSLASMNLMAKFAGAAGDPEYAQELFTRIGENWDQETWEKRENFEMVRNWAGFSAQLKNIVKEGTEAAESNRLTPAGLQFAQEIAKTLKSNYADMLAACATLAKEPAPASFDLFLQVGESGNIVQSFMNPTTRVTMCFQSALSKSRFPAPPKPSYWVKASMTKP